jgi:hypothetical protein
MNYIFFFAFFFFILAMRSSWLRPDELWTVLGSCSLTVRSVSHGHAAIAVKTA